MTAPAPLRRLRMVLIWFLAFVATGYLAIVVLLAANQRVADQPVRSISELLATADDREKRPGTKLTAAHQFLATTSQPTAYSQQRPEPTLRAAQTLPATFEESNQAQASPVQK